MKDPLFKLDDQSRRDFIARAAKTFLGVSTASLAGCSVKPPPADPTTGLPQAKIPLEPGDEILSVDAPYLNDKPTAKAVIYLYLGGGMTHLDTFDPKPDHGDAQVMGDTKTIATNVDGMRLGHWLEKSAKHMDKACVINSMNTTQGAHGPGQYYMHTSYTQRASIKHPRMGAWVGRLSGPLNPNLPASVFVGTDSVGGGAGFMPSRFGALGIGDPDTGLRNSRKPKGVTEQEFKKRLDMAKLLDTEFHSKYEMKEVQAYSDMYVDALRMMRSEDLKGFNIQDESSAMKELYGESKFGKGALLARRLVEHGVRFVEVRSGGWDMHNNIFEALPNKMAELDTVLSALLADLSLRGMLEETMVVLATEFGRTPVVTSDRNGRNHYPKAFSCMLAGGGIRGGQVYGKTDAGGKNVIENKVNVPDFNATIAYALGLPYNEIIYSPSKRPFTVADTGNPLVELFG